MAAVAVVLLVVACCAAALSAAPVRRPRRPAAWWRLDPITPDCDVDEAEVAVKRMSARRRRAVATIAHIGSDDARPELWLGVSAMGMQQAEGIAEGIAEAGGCRLGERGVPPKLPKERRRWWTAVPEMSEGSGMTKGASAPLRPCTGRCWSGSAPGSPTRWTRHSTGAMRGSCRSPRIRALLAPRWP